MLSLNNWFQKNAMECDETLKNFLANPENQWLLTYVLSDTIHKRPFKIDATTWLYTISREAISVLTDPHCKALMKEKPLLIAAVFHITPAGAALVQNAEARQDLQDLTASHWPFILNCHEQALEALQDSTLRKSIASPEFDFLMENKKSSIDINKVIMQLSSFINESKTITYPTAYDLAAKLFLSPIVQYGQIIGKPERDLIIQLLFHADLLLQNNRIWHALNDAKLKLIDKRNNYVELEPTFLHYTPLEPTFLLHPLSDSTKTHVQKHYLEPGYKIHEYSLFPGLDTLISEMVKNSAIVALLKQAPILIHNILLEPPFRQWTNKADKNKYLYIDAIKNILPITDYHPYLREHPQDFKKLTLRQRFILALDDYLIVANGQKTAAIIQIRDALKSGEDYISRKFYALDNFWYFNEGKLKKSLIKHGCVDPLKPYDGLAINIESLFGLPPYAVLVNKDVAPCSSMTVATASQATTKLHVRKVDPNLLRKGIDWDKLL